MKVVIPGGSGQVGGILARHFHARGDEVVVLSRTPVAAPWQVLAWDAQMLGPWAKEFDGADVIINLAGRSVNCRYTPHNRQVIKQSRLLSTQAVGNAIIQAQQPPKLWLQSSTATIYAHRYDAANDEATGILGGDEPNVPDTWRFSIDVAKSWEQAAEAIETPQTRKVLMRSSIMMSPDAGGPFDVLLRLVRFGLGGTEGDGRQYVSWIHDLDFVRAVDWLITHPALTGPVNLAAPHPLPNADFLRDLRAAWGAPLGLPALNWMLEIGALFLQTETELILKSRRVVPTRLMQSGFEFQFPLWPEAARDLCNRWRVNP
jgi:uncharacterized protein